jgi:hypothetical protein
VSRDIAPDRRKSPDVRAGPSALVGPLSSDAADDDALNNFFRILLEGITMSFTPVKSSHSCFRGRAIRSTTASQLGHRITIPIPLA